MRLFRRFLILTHRYIGIALSVFFVMWFATGIAMMYARNMPRLTSEMRLERLEPIDPARVQLTAAEAADRADLSNPPNQVALLTILGRPAYRFGRTTVFADTGERLRPLDATQARNVAGQFMRVSPESLTHVATLTSPDQWTLGQYRPPMYKFTVGDDSQTEVYVSGQSGEVSVMTTRGSRLMAWLGAIPHWLYFTSLRTNGPLWRQVVLWTSGVGIFLALMGIVLGIVQLKIRRPFRWSKISSYLPYSGWMRWHYISGLVFGVFTLTWVFSGWLSMEPFDWATEGGRFGTGLREAFTSAPGDLSEFPALTPASSTTLAQGGPVKEIEFVRIQDQPHYIIRRDPEGGTEVRGHQPYFALRARDAARTVVDARTMAVHESAFPTEALLTRVSRAVPGTTIVESEMLSTYDSYYYSRDGLATLPVLRVKLDDPQQTWLYIDPYMSQLVASVHRLDRVERWLYNGLHSLDFSFWYYRRPLWDVGMILLSLGGLTSATIGLFIGFKRVFRALGRMVQWRPRQVPVESYPRLTDS